MEQHWTPARITYIIRRSITPAAQPPMAIQPQSRQVMRFGLFEVDLRARELRKAGLKLKVHEQTLQLLGALIERPGEVITREELRQKLWPGDTFVDFDQGINTAIKKLREALGDSAENPRFVET